jgi:hypothetical protein
MEDEYLKKVREAFYRKVASTNWGEDKDEHSNQTKKGRKVKQQSKYVDWNKQRNKNLIK